MRQIKATSESDASDFVIKSRFESISELIEIRFRRAEISGDSFKSDLASAETRAGETRASNIGGFPPGRKSISDATFTLLRHLSLRPFRARSGCRAGSHPLEHERSINTHLRVTTKGRALCYLLSSISFPSEFHFANSAASVFQKRQNRCNHCRFATSAYVSSGEICINTLAAACNCYRVTAIISIC